MSDSDWPEGHPYCTEPHPDTGAMCDLPMGHKGEHRRRPLHDEHPGLRWSTPTGADWERAVEHARATGNDEEYRRLIRAY